ncbi:glycosyltransferase [Luteimicrobium sp. NPDC057192]|uniref:glycosyltransferase n=1 Tax=Luteimicrobium sp. NPDC057192 TaxID=3346042 RepID=UPI00363A4347
MVDGVGAEPRVSVVVPVHEPSVGFDDLCRSLWDQTLPDDAYEVVLVDDGSADETPQRLAAIARAHPHVRVDRIPASGWPGRPRNVGVGRARGRYVFFADQDDYLFPEALERMCAVADTNLSDLVMGKVVQLGAPTPYWSLWQRDVARADLVRDGVTLSRTVHKLFRREFLLAHDVRFPEGRVRLEDYHVMGQVFARSPAVSVLASYPCYRWLRHGANASGRSTPRAAYWDYYAEAMGIVDALGGPAEVADAVKIAATGQAFTRAALAGWLEHPADQQRAELAVLADWVDDAVPERLDERQPVVRRVQLAALRRRDPAAFLAAQRLRADAAATNVPVSAAWTPDGLLEVTCRIRAVLPGLRRDDPLGGERWAVLGIPDDGTYDLRLLDVDRPSASLSVRERASGVEWPVASRFTVAPEPSGAELVVSGHLDPTAGAFGGPWGPGVWDLNVRAALLGRQFLRRARVPEGWAAPGRRCGDLTASPYRTRAGTLAVRAVPVPDRVAADG